MTATADHMRAHALVDDVLNPPDQAADRAIAVLHAHAAALAWVRDTTGHYPAPASVAAHLDRVSRRLRTGQEPGDPAAIMRQAAVDALATHQSTAAA